MWWRQDTLCEAAKGFVDAVRPSKKQQGGQHAVYGLIQQNNELKNLFDNLSTEVKANVQFDQLRSVRNAVLFHYDYKMKETEEAIKRVEKMLSQRGVKDIVCFAYDENMGMYRLPIGDTVLDAVWQSLNLIPPGTDLDMSSEVEQVRSHRSRLGRAFITFAERLLFVWLDQNQLVVE